MRKTDRVTVGKITYLHPSFQHEPESLLPWHEPITLAQLEAGENDPALGQPMPDAPSVRQYDGNLDVEMHFGQPSTPLLHLDEFDVWTPEQNRAADQREPSQWGAALVGVVSGAVLILATVSLILLGQQMGLPAFFDTLFSTLTTTGK